MNTHESSRPGVVTANESRPASRWRDVVVATGFAAVALLMLVAAISLLFIWGKVVFNVVSLLVV